MDGTEIGSAPRMRHFVDCGHFIFEDGTVLGTPILASAEQMRDLPVCKTCVQREFGSEASGGGRALRYGDPCATCFQTLPITGICDNCG